MGGSTAVRLRTTRGRAVVAAAALGSGMTFLDGTVVNVALRTIGEDLDASLAELQWVTNGYLLSLASLILLGGSLGDRYGRRRVFVIGTVWFALASLLCGLAPTPEILIAARVLQGVGAALLMPGSLAMIQGSFRREDRAPGDRRLVRAGQHLRRDRPVRRRRARAVRRLALDLPDQPAAGGRHGRWSRGAGCRRRSTRTRPTRFDIAGAVLAAVALGGTTYALIEWGDALAPWAAGAALLAAVGFVVVERTQRAPDAAAGHLRQPHLQRRERR